MKTLSIEEMRGQVDNLAELLDTEKEIVVTSLDEPIARILPIRKKHLIPSHEDLRNLTPFQSIPSEVHVAIDREDR